jgi:DNA polymerase, archaeal type II, large subunit
LDGWGWIDRLVRKGSGEKDTENKSTFLDDIIAGRPVFSHPMAKGGFRLRYGRGRNSGFATAGINPTTMLIFGETLAPGTQMKMDVPGKAAGIVPVDSIEGPTVRLLNGDVVRLDTYDDLLSKGSLSRKNILDQIDTILDVGEILINFGDFLENNHPLMPSSYCIEWWLLELENATVEHFQMEDYAKISGRCALEISRRYNIPLHPNFTYLWHDIEEDEYKKLVETVKEFGHLERERDILSVSNLGIKGILEELLLEHKIRDGKIIIEDALPFLACLGLDDKLNDCKSKICKGDRKDVLEIIKERSGLVVRKKAPSRIGGRMGRPEKSKERKMSPPAHVLFPVGRESNRRSIQKAIDLSKDKNGRIRVKMGMRRCKKCGKKTVSIFCDCGGDTEAIKKDDVTETEVNIKKIYEDALDRLCERDTVEVKGVKGMISKYKIPEPLEKGILRAKHDIYVFKDGTIRYDMTDLPITHFNSKEIGTPINKLKDLGYDKDYTGKPLKDEEQLIEIFPQDIIVSNDCGDYLVKIANYMDDLIEKFYGISPFYGIKDREGLIGELVIGLAPHTSAGVLGRIIGFIESSVCYAHPYFHAAKRRNCDGDEDCVMLLLDGLINFSKEYLPEGRGRLMDSPLVLTERIDPKEVDGEVHNMDICYRYPLDFYLSTLKCEDPKNIEMEMIKDRLNTNSQYENLGFTQEVTDISKGPLMSSYKTLETMREKMELQLKIAKKTRAVDEDDVAERILKSHFIPDIIGNLRAFSTQKFRCVRCNAKFRRPPLSKKCPRCGGKIILTVHEASIKKYLGASYRILEEFKISEYTRQRIELLKMEIESLFKEDKDDLNVEDLRGQKELSDFAS